jgi:hypothetical protein
VEGALVIVEGEELIAVSRLSVARGAVKERIKLTSVESEALEEMKRRGLHRPPGRHGLWRIRGRGSPRMRLKMGGGDVVLRGRGGGGER